MTLVAGASVSWTWGGQEIESEGPVGSWKSDGGIWVARLGHGGAGHLSITRATTVRRESMLPATLWIKGRLSITQPTRGVVGRPEGSAARSGGNRGGS